MEERIRSQGLKNKQLLTLEMKKVVAEGLKELLPEALKNESIVFSYDKIEIYVKDECYPFVLLPRVTGDVKIFYYQRKGEYFVKLGSLLTEKNLKNKKLKSNQGKISKIGKSVLFVMGMTVFLAACQANQRPTKEPVAIAKSIEEDREFEVVQNSSEIFLETMEQREYPYETVEVYRGVDIEKEIVMAVKTKNEMGMKKRQETDQLGGSVIEECCARNGVPASLVSALFTQERPEYKSFDKKTNNWGQLTTSICGEKIIAPVIKNGEVVGMDKVYILDPFYDQYSKENLDEFSDIARLKREGWEVYQRSEAFYDLENNIRVSIAYFSYLVNKKEDLFLGAMSYHAGYPSVRSNYTYDDLLNRRVNGPDPDYIYHITSYLTEKELQDALRVYYQNGKIIDYKINNLNRDESYEEEIGHNIRK